MLVAGSVVWLVMVPAGASPSNSMVKHLVHMAAAADSLDDLLAEVAALAEMQGVGETGFGGEIGVGDVDAVSGIWCGFVRFRPVESRAGMAPASTRVSRRMGASRGLR